MQVNAYAKINLTLDILGRRDDGYHDISSVMQSVGIYDRLSIYLTDDPGVVKLRVLDWRSGEPESPAIPADETNLVSRAAYAILKDTGEVRRARRESNPTQGNPDASWAWRGQHRRRRHFARAEHAAGRALLARGIGADGCMARRGRAVFSSGAAPAWWKVSGIK